MASKDVPVIGIGPQAQQIREMVESVRREGYSEDYRKGLEEAANLAIEHSRIPGATLEQAAHAIRKLKDQDDG